ncbi:MAG: lysophospholipid acyltransferase family protein [Bacillota bacterium]|nr:lysophospholipid acyltransferase family protein [Bacillota bacterium]
MYYYLVRGLAGIVVRIIFDYRVEGSGKVPERGPLVLASNHANGWDPLLIACAIRRPISFMAKIELFRQPILGWLMPRIKAFPVKRSVTDRQAIRRGLELLRQGEALGIFPEGTRHRDGLDHEGFSGVVYFAVKGNAPVVPIGVKVGKGLRPVACVRVGDLMRMDEPGERADQKVFDEKTEMVMAAIRKLFHEGEAR